MYGEIEWAESLEALSSSLSGLDAAVRHSSHYVGGSYLLVETTSDAELRLERSLAGSLLINAEADSAAALVVPGSTLSQALAANGVRHRIELYEGEVLTHYWHHD